MARRQANSVSSMCTSLSVVTSSSMMRVPIRLISTSEDTRGMMKSLPSSNTFFKWIERRARPSRRCSPACARSSATWSSIESSVNEGTDFAQSTRMRSCCFMDSHTSPMLAIFLFEILNSLTGVDIFLEYISALSRFLTESPDELLESS